MNIVLLSHGLASYHFCRNEIVKSLKAKCCFCHFQRDLQTKTIGVEGVKVFICLLGRSTCLSSKEWMDMSVLVRLTTEPVFHSCYLKFYCLCTCNWLVGILGQSADNMLSTHLLVMLSVSTWDNCSLMIFYGHLGHSSEIPCSLWNWKRWIELSYPFRSDASIYTPILFFHVLTD